jgi:hypothetical protein
MQPNIGKERSVSGCRNSSHIGSKHQSVNMKNFNWTIYSQALIILGIASAKPTK